MAWCNDCGFDRSRISETRCPECGTTNPPVAERPTLARKLNEWPGSFRVTDLLCHSVSLAALATAVSWFCWLCIDPTLLMNVGDRIWITILTLLLGLPIIGVGIVATHLIGWSRWRRTSYIAIVTLTLSVLVVPWTSHLTFRIQLSELKRVEAEYLATGAVVVPRRIGPFTIDGTWPLGADAIVLSSGNGSLEGYIYSPRGRDFDGLDNNQLYRTRWIGGNWHVSFWDD